MDTDVYVDEHDQLRRYRGGASLREFARRLDISKSYLHDMETGNRPVRDDVLVRASQAASESGGAR